MSNSVPVMGSGTESVKQSMTLPEKLLLLSVTSTPGLLKLV
jgi:hypothetical protein